MAKLYVFPFKAKRISVMGLTMRLVTVKEKRLFYVQPHLALLDTLSLTTLTGNWCIVYGPFWCRLCDII